MQYFICIFHYIQYSVIWYRRWWFLKTTNFESTWKNRFFHWRLEDSTKIVLSCNDYTPYTSTLYAKLCRFWEVKYRDDLVHIGKVIIFYDVRPIYQISMPSIATPTHQFSMKYTQKHERIQYEYTQKQCVDVVIEGMDIW